MHRPQKPDRSGKAPPGRLGSETVGRPVNGIAHELNNLLTAVLGHGEIIAAAATRGEAVSQSARRIRTAATRAAELVRRLLAISRRDDSQRRILNLNEVVRDTLAELKPVLGAGIQTETRLCGQAALIEADPDLMEQMVSNLCLNAQGAMSRGGRLTLETTVVHLEKLGEGEDAAIEPGTYVTFAVHDTGAEFDGEVRAPRFRRVVATRKLTSGNGPSWRRCAGSWSSTAGGS